MTIHLRFSLASLAFGKDNIGDQEWLRGRFRMHNVLRETPIYQEMTKEAREEGLQQGRQLGLQQGLRDVLLDVVLDRFPKLIHLARKQIDVIVEPVILRHLIVKLSAAQNTEEAKQYLLEVDEGEDED
jgi:predicted transposase YdaD